MGSWIGIPAEKSCSFCCLPRLALPELAYPDKGLISYSHAPGKSIFFPRRGIGHESCSYLVLKWRYRHIHRAGFAVFQLAEQAAYLGKILSNSHWFEYLPPCI